MQDCFPDSAAVPAGAVTPPLALALLA